MHKALQHDLFETMQLQDIILIEKKIFSSEQEESQVAGKLNF